MSEHPDPKLGLGLDLSQVRLDGRNRTIFFSLRGSDLVNLSPCPHPDLNCAEKEKLCRIVIKCEIASVYRRKCYYAPARLAANPAGL